MKCRARLTLAILPLAALLATPASASVAPTQVFQLDGKADNSGLTTCLYSGVCDYWNLLNGTGGVLSGLGTGSHPGNSLIRTFIDGTASTNSFTGGGSKDPNPISQWSYSGSPTPNKDTLNAGFAAAYSQAGDFLLTFGANRASPNGDANIGIWFFQNSVLPDGNGGFTGSHMEHDIFVISAFTGGGGTSTVSVYEWDHTCSSGVKNPAAGACADSNLRVLAIPNTSCGSSIYCGITNAATTSTTWQGNLASPLFFEGGVNLTAAFSAVGGVSQLPCFSSFLEETRSSQSPSAVLKDFVAGGFPVCGLRTTKVCGTAAPNATATQFTFPVNGVVTNTGVGTLYNVKLFDTPTGETQKAGIAVLNNTPNSTNNGSSTLGAGETGTWADSTTSTSTSASDSAFAQGALDSQTTPNGVRTQSNTVSSESATATCPVSLSTSLSISKSCGIPAVGANVAVPGVTLTTAGSVGVRVSYSGQVCNNGKSQVTGIVLTDYPSSGTSGAPGSLGATTLPPCTTFASNGSCTEGDGANCTSYSGNYVPTNIDVIATVTGGVPSTAPGRYFFNDVAAITKATATIGTLNTLGTGTYADDYGMASASCPICQGSGECTTQ